jgi:hypothetical protein
MHCKTDTNDIIEIAKRTLARNIGPKLGKQGNAQVATPRRGIKPRSGIGAMPQQHHKPDTFKERFARAVQQSLDRAGKLAPGPQRDILLAKIRQLEMAADLLSSKQMDR